MEWFTTWMSGLLGVPWPVLRSELLWFLLSVLGGYALLYVAYLAIRPEKDLMRHDKAVRSHQNSVLAASAGASAVDEGD